MAVETHKFNTYWCFDFGYKPRGYKTGGWGFYPAEIHKTWEESDVIYAPADLTYYQAKRWVIKNLPAGEWFVAP